MYQRFTISVVLPCLNEEAGIARVISQMPKFVDEIIVVDNNSVDNTAKVAKAIGARIIKEGKKGYGLALKAGILKAKSDLIIIMDGDGTYPASEVTKLLEEMGRKNLDFVSGNRLDKRYKNLLPILNLLGNKLLTLIANCLFNIEIHDSQSGMMLFKREVVPYLKMESDGMRFSEELKINALRSKNIKFGEYPIYYNAFNRLGKTKLRLWRDGFSNLYYLCKKYYNRRSENF